jgi:hypothetical protein
MHDVPVDLFDGEPYADLMPCRLRPLIDWALFCRQCFHLGGANWALDQAGHPMTDGSAVCCVPEQVSH